MENARQVGWITGYEPQRALVIESLETIEQLPGDFQVRLHSQPHEYQLIHFCWRANGGRCRSDASERKIRVGGCRPWHAGALRRRLGGAGLSFPNGQTVDRAPSEILIVGDGTNHLGKASTGLDEVELFGFAVLVRRERAGDARCIARWVQSRSGSGGADQSRPQFGLSIAPVLCEVCAFELIRVNRQDGIGFLREPFASTRRLENNEQDDRQQNQNRKRAEVKLPQLLFIDLAGELGQLCLVL